MKKMTTLSKSIGILAIVLFVTGLSLSIKSGIQDSNSTGANLMLYGFLAAVIAVLTAVAEDKHAVKA